MDITVANCVADRGLPSLICVTTCLGGRQHEQKEAFIPMWKQYQLTIPSQSRGLHLITRAVVKVATDLPDIRVGMLNLFLQHTSASLTINENADPDVQVDLERALNYVAPDDLPYIHTCEGPDDMPAHTKSSLFGCSLNIPVKDGELALGTWQGIYLCEHRDRATARRIVITLQGDS